MKKNATFSIRIAARDLDTITDRYHSLVLLGNFQRSLRDAKGRGLFQQFFGGDLSMLQQFQQQTLIQ